MEYAMRSAAAECSADSVTKHILVLYYVLRTFCHLPCHLAPLILNLNIYVVKITPEFDTTL